MFKKYFVKFSIIFENEQLNFTVEPRKILKIILATLKIYMGNLNLLDFPHFPMGIFTVTRF